VTPNIYGSVVWDLLVCFVPHKILKWCVHFWKICGIWECIILATASTL